MQTKDHSNVKRELEQLLSELGYPFVRRELKRCDVIFSDGCSVCGAEYERTARNVLANLDRNIANDIDFNLIVPSDFCVARDIAHKLATDLPKEFYQRVGLVTLPALRLLAGKLAAASSDAAHQP